MKLVHLMSADELKTALDDQGRLSFPAPAVFALPNGKTAAAQMPKAKPALVMQKKQEAKPRKERKKSRKQLLKEKLADPQEKITQTAREIPVISTQPECAETTQEAADARQWVWIEIDDRNPHLKERLEWDNSQPVRFARLSGTLNQEDYQIQNPEPERLERRIHVLMNTSMIDEAWCRRSIAPYLKPDDRVCVLALSFFDDTRTLDDWNRQYQPGRGIWYKANTDVFAAFGIEENQVEWVNYFTDSPQEMAAKIQNSTILMLPGGAPDLFMERIREKKLHKYLRHYEGVIIGYSAGAMIQLDSYHIIPDCDYPQFSWQRGLGYLDDFDIEVHYCASPHQIKWVDYVRSNQDKPIYCIYEQGGMIVDGSGKVLTCFGQVDYVE